MIIGLFLRHIKAYKGIKFIPIGEKYNFVSYLGENGSGKSSILEALDAFFNNREYSINKSAQKDGITGNNFPFITPIFLIEKNKIYKHSEIFEKISNFFWLVDKKDLSIVAQGAMKDFFELRDSLSKEKYSKESHYLIIMGENISNKQIHFTSFIHRDVNFINMLLGTGKAWISNSQLKKEDIEDKVQLLEAELTNKEYREVLHHLKSAYSFVYIPVEIDVEDFTKIETENMQKICNKCIKDEIRESLKGAKLANISNKLNLLMNEIETTLKGEYYYDTESAAKKNLTENDFLGKVLEVYFQSRILKKTTFNNKKYDKKVKELSAGEKRQALISLIYAFLKDEKERDPILILGIDEPENSLHTSLCYEQFEKLKEISKNNQILITTHWYGFLPIISEGIGHFLHKDETKDESTDGITFETYDLYDYRAQIKKDIQKNQNKIPKDYTLKSTNDLVQSIFYSLKGDNGYNWLICEGISEKIYFEYFFKEEIENNNLRILPMGGQSKVSEIYEYLELPIRNEKEYLNGKVFCLIDTDAERHKDNIGDIHKNLKIKRLFNDDENQTSLITLNNKKTGETYIENALNPSIFKATLIELELEKEYPIKIKNNHGNTDFIKNLKNYELKTFFEENEGENKIAFANEYVAIMRNTNTPENVIPNWIYEIKSFFKNGSVINDNHNEEDKILITKVR